MGQKNKQNEQKQEAGPKNDGSARGFLGTIGLPPGKWTNTLEKKCDDAGKVHTDEIHEK